MANIHYGVKASRKQGVPTTAKIHYGVKTDLFKYAFHGGERGHCVTIWDRPVRHQCGLLGCRVGEASNRGPVVTRQGRRLERSTQIDVSTSEEPVRPNCGR